MFKKVSITLSIIFSTFLGQAQDTWTLERCIEYAQKNNINVKQSQLQVNGSDIAAQQSKAARYPGVNFSTNLGANFGRVINPQTNQFDNKAIGFNSGSVNINQIVYDGGRINASIKQAQINHQAAESDLEQTVLNISLNVAQAYLQILLGEEQTTSAKKRYDQSKAQLEQIEKLIKAGSRAGNERLDFVAQTTRTEQSVVAAQNNVDLAYLNLKQLLELDPESAFKIERPANINLTNISDFEGLTMRAVYNQAFSRQPQIKAGELRLKSAEIDADIARSDRLPSISLFGSLSTNYSTAANKILDRSQPIPFILSEPSSVVINGTPASFQSYGIDFDNISMKNNPFYRQYADNFGQAVGVSLQVPIYDRGMTRLAIERARLNAANQQLTNQRTQQQLKNDIQVALANAKAAKKQYDAADKTLSAATLAYESMEKRFKSGASSSFELTTARNNADTAERDLIIAKYDYLFKVKIVDFYQGRKISMN